MAKRRAIKINGMKNLEKKIGNLRLRVKGPEALQIAFDAASPVGDAVRGEAPLGATGLLKQSIKVGKFKPRIDKPIAAFVLSDPRVAFYGRFVHDGTYGNPGNPFFKRAVASTRRGAQAFMLAQYKRLVEKGT